jgi:hypothetical protein
MHTKISGRLRNVTRAGTRSLGMAVQCMWIIIIVVIIAIVGLSVAQI